MNTKEIAIGALLATTTIFAIGGGVGLPQRAEIPHIVNVTSSQVHGNQYGGTEVVILTRIWSDGVAETARIWGSNHNRLWYNGSGYTFGTSLTSEPWQILPTTN